MIAKQRVGKSLDRLGILMDKDLYDHYCSKLEPDVVFDHYQLSTVLTAREVVCDVFGFGLDEDVFGRSKQPIRQRCYLDSVRRYSFWQRQVEVVADVPMVFEEAGAEEEV